MASSSHTRDLRLNTTVKPSEDIEDIYHIAQKTALKQGESTPLDRHFLLGLIKTDRLFTRVNALLKYSGTSAKQLNKLFKQEWEAFKSTPSTNTALDKAEEYALKSASNEKPRIEIEHLLLGLAHSPDPLVKSVMQKANINSNVIENAIPKVKEESPIRFTLYCLREALEVIVVVLVLVILIKQGLGEFRLIPSESMLPSLQIGDRIVVEKVTHWTRNPQRGDILVFYPPEPETYLRHDPWSVFLRLTGFSGLLYNKESRIDTAFIKRVVGLPGDVVDVVPGQGVYVNGRLLDEPYVTEAPNTCTFITQCGPVRVPDKMYYMMGDNRNHSADSRYWKFLPEDRIIGRAVFRFFPLHRVGTLQSPKSTQQEIHH